MKQQETKTSNTPEENMNTTPEPKTPATKDAKDSKIEELINDLQRTRADFENFRKNVEKDRENAKKLASYATVAKFLPLLDDFDRAIKTYEELKPLEKSFAKSLKNLNLEKIDTKPGTEFNPEYHDAVMTEGDGEKETIAETLRDGYFYEGEVIRPAMVKIKLQ